MQTREEAVNKKIDDFLRQLDTCKTEEERREKVKTLIFTIIQGAIRSTLERIL